MSAIAALLETLIGQAILFNEDVARSLGISAVDLQTFGVISRCDGPITASEIAALTRLPASTTTRVLDRLEQRGFVVRSSTPDDRRKVLVEAVPARAAEVATQYAEKIEQISQLNARRSEAELDVVVSYLRDLASDQDI